MKAMDKDRVSYFWDKIKKLVKKETKNVVRSSDTSVKDWITVTQDEFNDLKNKGQLIEGTIYNVLDGCIPASTSIPVGTGMLWYGELDALPDGLLPQDGRSLNKNEYSSLFKVLGYKYGGSGDNFNLPDVRGRVIVHADGSTEFENLGDKVGEKKHKLTASEMPIHYHASYYKWLNNEAGADSGTWNTDTWSKVVSKKYTSNTTKDDGKDGSRVGGDQAHNNIQPSFVAYYVIKVKEDVYVEDVRNLDVYANNLQKTFEDAAKHMSSGILGGISFWPNDLSKLPITYKVCNGQTLNISEYPQLFEIIGTRYGGNGTTTFNLPNIEGYTLVGLNDGDTEFGTLGNKIGEKFHQLTVGELPEHDHHLKASGVNDGTTVNNQIGNYPIRIYQDKASNWPVYGDKWYSQRTGNNQVHNNIQPSFIGYYVMKVLPDLYDESNDLLQSLLTRLAKVEEKAVNNYITIMANRHKQTLSTAWTNEKITNMKQVNGASVSNYFKFENDSIVIKKRCWGMLLGKTSVYSPANEFHLKILKNGEVSDNTYITHDRTEWITVSLFNGSMFEPGDVLSLVYSSGTTGEYEFGTPTKLMLILLDKEV